MCIRDRIPDDVSLFLASNVALSGLLYVLITLSTVTSFIFLRKRWSWAPSAIAAPIFGYGIGRVMMLLFWMLFFFLILGNYDPIMFLSSFHSLDPLAGRSEVKFIVSISV